MRLLLLALSVLTFLGAPALGQNLPNHFDPSAREAAPEATGVPAIRFLTTADFPPFNYRDESGELVGFNIDLARGLCTELAVACTIQAWPWEQAARALADNQGDALLAGLALSPENGEQFDFSSIYLGFPARFVTRVGPAQNFSAESLSGRRLAVREGSAHQGFLVRYLPDATIVPFESEIAALDAVESGDVDAFFGDALRASFWLNTHMACCTFAGGPYFRPDLFGEGLAVALPAGRDAVREAINLGLLRMKRSGALDELYLRWFPVGFY
ncbi:transporter substrate-binding domain-containing protein [Arsenicitalea aurantiaca]|nr:transporter substrate-binding domain-containing protein [Arsenicitalea aurantiaca]